MGILTPISTSVKYLSCCLSYFFFLMVVRFVVVLVTDQAQPGLFYKQCSPNLLTSLLYYHIVGVTTQQILPDCWYYHIVGNTTQLIIPDCWYCHIVGITILSLLPDCELFGNTQNMVSEGIHFLFPAYVAFFSSKVQILDCEFVRFLDFFYNSFLLLGTLGFVDFLWFFLLL